MGDASSGPGKSLLRDPNLPDEVTRRARRFRGVRFGARASGESHKIIA